MTVRKPYQSTVAVVTQSTIDSSRIEEEALEPGELEDTRRSWRVRLAEGATRPRLRPSRLLRARLVRCFPGRCS